MALGCTDVEGSRVTRPTQCSGTKSQRGMRTGVTGDAQSKWGRLGGGEKEVRN